MEIEAFIKAPAKLNLHLRVLNRRKDGYHEINSIMVPVSLYDFIYVRTLSEEGIEIISESDNIPKGEDNLLWIAADRFFKCSGIRGGVSVKIVKNIPVAAGLGGGSSDAARLLVLLNSIFKDVLSFKALYNIAKEIGADVPFFLRCKGSIARGIGDILEEIPHIPSFWYVLVCPPVRVSTKWAYENIKLELTGYENSNNITFQDIDDFSISEILRNDLEEVVSERYSVVREIEDLLMETKPEGVLMSGSGPSVFGIYEDLDNAKEAKDMMISHQVGDVFLVKEI